MAVYLDPLYNPVSPPAPLGQAPAQSNMQAQPFNPTQQAMAQGLTGSNPNALIPRLPVGTGNTMYTGPMFQQEDIANVGGVTSMAPTEDTKAFIPEVESALDKQVTEFHDAAAGEGSFKTYDSKGEQITGKKAARRAKKADRQADRQARKDAGLKGAEKRQMRRAQRRQRKSAWQTYKGESDLAAEEAAAGLE